MESMRCGSEKAFVVAEMRAAGLGCALLVTLVALVAVGAGSAAPSGDEWLWAVEDNDSVQVRSSMKAEPPQGSARNPAVPSKMDPFNGPPASIGVSDGFADGVAAYVQRVLSVACCRGAHTFNVETGSCEDAQKSSPFAPADSVLTFRSALTSLPPNCPPGKRYDSESEICRDEWGG